MEDKLGFRCRFFRRGDLPDAIRLLAQDRGLFQKDLWNRLPELILDLMERNRLVGGVVEDPATGSAAAALGGYLRAAGLVAVPTTLLIRQGEAMGRPSQLRVTIPATGGIVVSGGAVRLP